MTNPHLHYSPPKKGKTPEAKVTAECDRYLKLIGVINIRANAGAWADDAGHMIQGAKAGTADKILCVAGRFVALELKAETKQSDAQAKFQARVEALGGLYILAHGKDELRAALVAEFGAAAVASWEAAGRAREKALRTPKRNF